MRFGFQLAADRRCVWVHRLAAVRRPCEDFVVDLDQRDRVLGEIAIIGDDDRDGFAHIGNLAVGEREGPDAVERRSGIRMPQHAPFRQHGREIIQREHRTHAWCRQRRRLVDRGNQRMRMRAANKGRAAPRHHDIVYEAPASAQQGLVLDAGNARSNQRCHDFLEVPVRLKNVSPTSWLWRLSRQPHAASHRPQPRGRRPPWR